GRGRRSGRSAGLSQRRTAPRRPERRRRLHTQHPTQERQGNGRAAVRRRKRRRYRAEAGHFGQEGRSQRSVPMRERQEIQAMPRSLVLAFVFLSCASAAGIWPERLGTYDRKAVQQLPLVGVGANEYGQE